MATLSNILRDSLIELGELRINTATGGSTASVVDSGLGGSDDELIGGTVIVIHDDGDASAAPEEEFGEIVDYTASSGTIAVASGGFTVAPASGDVYGVSTPKYPHFQMIEHINRALQVIGDIPLIDTTTLDTAAAQTEYAAAVAWKRMPPTRVDIQTNTSDANDNEWLTVRDWEYVPAAGGSTGLIIFRDQLPTSRDLRIWYVGPHPEVRDYDDVIYEGIHPERVVWETVFRALRWRLAKGTGLSEWELQLINEANTTREAAKKDHSIWMPKRRNKLLIINDRVSDSHFKTPDPA